jgi:CHC2 zinc finger
MFPPEFLREIRARTPLAAVVGRNVRLTRAGRRHWKSCCPFHGEKTPSFHVYDDGHYHCFGCGAHGDAISYVMQMEGVGFRAAAQQLARDAGMSLPDTSPPASEQEAADRRARLAPRQAEYARQAAEREAKAAREFAADVQQARDYIASLPHYLGTLGERSLHVMRGVPRAAWSDAIRYDPARRCLVYIATDDAGDVQGGQQVFLERDGRNRRRFNRRGSFKLTIGHPRAGKAAVRLAGDAAWAVAIGEGVENTAVVAGALGIAGQAALGPFTTIEPPVGVLTIAVLDGDAPDSAAAIAQADWIERWRSEGRHIVPVSARDWTGQKFDFADLVASAGVNAVRQRIQAALLEHQGLAPADPPRLLPNASVADARAALVRFTREAFSPSDDGLPRQTLIGGEGGIGKTETVGQYMPHAMLQAKQAGRPWRIIYMVPEHVNLGPQVTERFARLGLNVFRLEGRGDPFAIAPVRKPRCGNMPAVAEAIRAGQSVREAVCGTPKGKHCTLFHTCHDDGYLGDLRRAAEVDVLVVAHAYLINHLPEQVRHDVGWLVIDEDFTASLDYVRSLTIETFTRAAIEHFPVLTNGERDALSTAKLGHLTELIERAIAGATDDYLPAAALRAVGLTVHDCEVAAKLTWQRKIDVAMTPETDATPQGNGGPGADQSPATRDRCGLARLARGARGRRGRRGAHLAHHTELPQRHLARDHRPYAEAASPMAR